ncbi:MAG: DUF4340 domain-containing protein [Bacteroidota bacterium]
MRKRYLIILSLFGLVIYGLTQFSIQTSAQQFETRLFPLDTTQIQQIIIQPIASKEAKKIQFYRLPRWWEVSQGQVSTPALRSTMNEILSVIQSVETVRVASNSAEEWSAFGLASDALQLTLILDDGTTETILLGQRISEGGKIQRDTTFARFPNEQEVYALRNLNQALFDRSFDYYRQKGVVVLDKKQRITQLAQLGGDTLTKVGDRWQKSDSSWLNTPLVNAYVTDLSRVEAVHFADDFDEIQMEFLACESFSIKGESFVEDVQIRACYDSTATLPFIIHSSQFPTAFYASDSSGLYQQLFGVFMDSLTTTTDTLVMDSILVEEHVMVSERAMLPL